METSDDEMVAGTPPKIFKAAKDAKLSLLPAKSKKMYKAYDEFVSWCKMENVRDGNHTGNVFLAYFLEKSNCRKTSSLWSCYSMLKATANLHHNINVASIYKPKKIKNSNQRRNIIIFSRCSG
ncbi:unnamed protein product [Callosobruchus maculatus]|uniref:Uncharacterized protein n=1 Tax=Callosobruchus maculatus TaxID=64391 RepID=A0A653C0N6_CALMS|nr:unnamed protein product [Callosobruchus maculatus]